MQIWLAAETRLPTVHGKTEVSERAFQGRQNIKRVPEMFYMERCSREGHLNEVRRQKVRTKTILLPMLFERQ